MVTYWKINCTRPASCLLSVHLSSFFVEEVFLWIIPSLLFSVLKLFINQDAFLISYSSQCIFPQHKNMMMQISLIFIKQKQKSKLSFETGKKIGYPVHSICKEMNSDPYLPPFKNINSKWTKDWMEHKTENDSTVTRKHKHKSLWCQLGNNFLYTSSTSNKRRDTLIGCYLN